MPFTKDDATLAFEEIDKTNSGTITKMPQLQDYCNTNHINVSKMCAAPLSSLGRCATDLNFSLFCS